MKKKINIGVIGLGRMGRLRLPILEKIPGVSIAGLADLNPKNTEPITLAQNYHLPLQTAENLIANPDLKVLFICSGTHTHLDYVVRALEQGKYVFCEKPLGTQTQAIQNLYIRYPDLDKRLMVGFNRRFDPDFSYLKAHLKEIGRPAIIKITSRDPYPPSLDYIKSSGGIFYDMSIHDLDMARFIAGKADEVESVSVTGSIHYITGIEGIDIDAALITLRFKSGLLCNIDNSRQSPYGYDQRLEVLGDKGMIQAANKQQHQCALFTDQGKQSAVLEPFFLERYKKAYIRETNAFFHSLSKEEVFPTTARDAIKALRLAGACQKALQEKTILYF